MKLLFIEKSELVFPMAGAVTSHDVNCLSLLLLAVAVVRCCHDGRHGDHPRLAGSVGDVR